MSGWVATVVVSMLIGYILGRMTDTVEPVHPDRSAREVER